MEEEKEPVFAMEYIDGTRLVNIIEFD